MRDNVDVMLFVSAGGKGSELEATICGSGI